MTADIACQLSSEIAPWPSKFFAAMSQADDRIVELDRLHDWQRRVAGALGLAETVEGIGYVVVVNNAEEAADYARHYTKTALTHERDCPVFCDDCEHYELPFSCKRCSGSGCGPGTALGAYEPCGNCDGLGRDHSFAYVHVLDAGIELEALRAENAELDIRVRELKSECAQWAQGFTAAVAERDVARSEADTWRARAAPASAPPR